MDNYADGPKITIRFRNVLVTNWNNEKQAQAVAALTLGIPLTLPSFYTINTKNTQVTHRRVCAYSARAAVNSLTSQCPVQVEDTPRALCLAHTPPGKNSTWAAFHWIRRAETVTKCLKYVRVAFSEVNVNFSKYIKSMLIFDCWQTNDVSTTGLAYL